MRPHLRSVRPLLLALAAVGALALTACSSSDDASSGAPADVDAVDDGSSSSDDAAEDEGPRTVEHAMGSTEVPADPERVVVLDSSFLDSSIALGVTPVGATEGIAGAGLPAYLGDDVEGVELVGLTEEPSLEEVAALAPDLIVGAKVRHEDIYEQLSAIAPTVFSESSGTNWQDQVRLTGEALGRSDEAEQLLADVESRAAEVGEQVGAADMTATIVRFIPGQIRLYGPGTFSGSVLESVGFDLGDKGYDEQYGMAVISQERLDLIDADVVFATNPGEESEGRISTDREAAGPLWEQLPAVVEGRQHDITDSTWMTGIGVLGANRILDDVESMLG
jgi:iron complex transport system substrate-binding protein